jgi:hypothetical protein
VNFYPKAKRSEKNYEFSLLDLLSQGFLSAFFLFALFSPCNIFHMLLYVLGKFFPGMQDDILNFLVSNQIFFPPLFQFFFHEKHWLFHFQKDIFYI